MLIVNIRFSVFVILPTGVEAGIKEQSVKREEFQILGRRVFELGRVLATPWSITTSIKRIDANTFNPSIAATFELIHPRSV